MKRDELKKILKPLIKECIKEVIFEEGVLSTLVSEAVIGVSQTSQLLESKSNNNRSIREEANTQKRTNMKILRLYRMLDLPAHRRLLQGLSLMFLRATRALIYRSCPGHEIGLY